MKHSITVIDSIMGSGKTSYMIDHINRTVWNEEKAVNPTKWIFVTPNLTEVDRITKDCPVLNFRNPVPIHGKKYWGFKELIQNGHNICTTHALFRRMGRDIQAELKKQGYRLVIDEALDTVEVYTGLSSQDLKMLVKDEWIVVEENTGLLRWDESRPYIGKHSEIMGLCLNGALASRGEKLLLWEFPISFLDCFKDVTVMTYCFHGSPMAAYLAARGVRFNMKAIHNDRLVDWHTVDESEIKEKLRGLITVYEGRSNAVGDNKQGQQVLSSSWYKRTSRSNPDELDNLRKGMVSFFQNESKTHSKLNMWTTFKDYKKRLSGKGYTNGFTPNNLRATNDFKHKLAAAHTCNIFMHPVVKGYLQERGVTVYEDLYSLSELLQWVWRTGIRENNPIHVFIPSQRMRELFMVWLESDTVEELFQKLGYAEAILEAA